MKREFNPGDKVFVPATVTDIEINRVGVWYWVKFNGTTSGETMEKLVKVNEKTLMEIFSMIEEVKPVER